MAMITKTGIKHHYLASLLYLLIAGCSVSSPEYFYKEVEKQKLQRNVIQAGRFPLVYYSRNDKKASDTLHVYLGGDGIPWRNLVMISKDPSPHNPLILQLMKQDSTASVFLGRPCYQGLANTAPCDNKYWTSARYSTEVVESMRTGLQYLLRKYQSSRLVLIGYSGGGTLAVLLARTLPQTQMVITIAGNLDTDAWTDLHFYSPMTESLNPAIQGPLPTAIKQIHVQGERDTNIPPRLASSFLKKQTNAVVLLYPQADHSCCWHLYWADILHTIN